jgi:hypothetical protein
MVNLTGQYDGSVRTLIDEHSIAERSALATRLMRASVDKLRHGDAPSLSLIFVNR